MRFATWWLTGTAVLAITGCSGGSNPAVLAPTSTGIDPIPQPLTDSYSYNAAGALGAAVQSGNLINSALAIYTLDIDPSTLAATATLKEQRTGAATDDLYLLPIGSFLRPTSFRLTTVARDTENLNLGWVFTHPFPAPSDPTAPANGSTNRADLGVSAALVFLADVASASGNTYFTDRVANTALVASADAYYSPGALITTTGLTANTFPMQIVVDESADNRVEASNAGTVTGNFGTDGWTRAELGTGNNKWTGYDILHQGQSATGTLALDLDTVAAGGFALDLAVLAKYNDPRGGATATAKKANRLPPATPNTDLFGYRMPHGAWDVSQVRFLGADQAFLDTAISAATLSFHVTDWDARATETTEADLADDTNPTNVAVGEAGLPAFAVSIPGVLGDATVVDNWDPGTDVLDDDSAFGGDVGQDSGQRGDALFYSKAVTELLTSGQTPGTYTGLARVSDVEIANIADPFFVIELDGTLTPLASNIPAPISYGVFEVDVISANTPPSATAALTSADPMLSGTSPALSITSITDPDNNLLDIEVNWGDGAGFVPIVSGLATPYPDQTPTGPQMNNADLIVDTISVIVRLDDGFSPPVDYNLSYDLGPNRPPQVTGTPALAVATVMTPATFNMTLGTATATDPEGDAIGLYTSNNRNGDTSTSAGFTFPYPANLTSLTNPPDSNVTFTVRATDALHPGTAGTAYPTVDGTIRGGSGVGWVYDQLVSTTGVDELFSIAVDSAGNVYGAGNFPNSSPGVDFGGGLRPNTTSNMFLVKISGVDGSYIYDRVWTSTSASGRVFSLDIDSADNVYIAFGWTGTLSLAGLGGGATDQVAGTLQDLGVLKFNSAGAYLGMARSNDGADSGTNESHPAATIIGSGLGIGSRGMAIDKSTNAVYVGHSPTGLNPMNIGGLPVTITGGRDPVLTRFNGAAFQVDASTPAVWAVNLLAAASTANQRITSVAVAGPGGNVVVSGTFDVSADMGDGLVTSNGGVDVFIVQRNPVTGTHQPGSQRTYGSAGVDNALGLAATASHIFVSGGFGTAVGHSITLGAPIPPFTSVSNQEGYVACYTTANVPVWGRALLGAGTAAEHCFGGVVLSGADLFVLGAFQSTTPGANFGFAPLISLSSTDWVLAKFDAFTGNATGWQSTWGGGPASSFDNPFAVTVHAGNPIIVGRLQNGSGCDFDPGPAFAFRTMQTTDWAVVKLNGTTGEF